MTTEHYGLLGLLILLHGICKKYKLCKEECFDSVVIYIDNKAVVERGNIRQDIINISDYAVPDQDLWLITTELIEALPIKLDIRWIRGHQDSDEHGDKIHGPYTRAVTMNILTYTKFIYLHVNYESDNGSSSNHVYLSQWTDSILPLQLEALLFIPPMIPPLLCVVLIVIYCLSSFTLL